jgi:MraZ protein
MFTGRHFHSMDNKGRVSIPSRYREILQERQDRQVVLTNFYQRIQKDEPEQIRYIIAFPTPEWLKIATDLAKKPTFSSHMRNFQRFLVSGAEECPLDRQGRILIPPSLRDYAALSREVILVGALRGFEIWDRMAYETHWQQLEESIDEGMLDELLI